MIAFLFGFAWGLVALRALRVLVGCVYHTGVVCRFKGHMWLQGWYTDEEDLCPLPRPEDFCVRCHGRQPSSRWLRK